MQNLVYRDVLGHIYLCPPLDPYLHVTACFYDELTNLDVAYDFLIFSDWDA